VGIYTYLWLGMGLYFLVVEGFALFKSKPGSTLSAHVWAWFGTDINNRQNRSLWARLRRIALLAFLVWLVVHFMTGGMI
jgi:Ni,Fe-hydrogenase I cytochrome b subunit